MIIPPPPGSWCCGKQGILCQVIDSDNEVVVLDYNGTEVVKPLSQVCAWRKDNPGFHEGMWIYRGLFRFNAWVITQWPPVNGYVKLGKTDSVSVVYAKLDRINPL